MQVRDAMKSRPQENNNKSPALFQHVTALSHYACTMRSSHSHLRNMRNSRKEKFSLRIDNRSFVASRRVCFYLSAPSEGQTKAYFSLLTTVCKKSLSLEKVNLLVRRRDCG